MAKTQGKKLCFKSRYVSGDTNIETTVCLRNRCVGGDTRIKTVFEVKVFLPGHKDIDCV